MKSDFIKFGKKSKSSSKCHVFISGKAYCDPNIDGIIEIETSHGTEFCFNCIDKILRKMGGVSAAYAELSFYFTQYDGGSSFLDSIMMQLYEKRTLSPKQLKTSINIFRSGSFRRGKNSLVNELYS